MFVSSSAVYGRAVSNSFFVSQQWIANKYILEIIRKQRYSTSLSRVKITRIKQYKYRKKSGLKAFEFCDYRQHVVKCEVLFLMKDLCTKKKYVNSLRS